MAEVSGGIPQSMLDDIAALKTNMPVASTATPLSVSDASSPGTNATKFAQEGHVHASKARKQRVTGITAATYAWTYPTAFGAGVTPVCQAIVEDPGNVAADSYNVEVVGVPGNTSATFRIIRQSTGLLSLLTGALSLNPTPGTVNLHLLAFEP